MTDVLVNCLLVMGGWAAGLSLGYAVWGAASRRKPKQVSLTPTEHQVVAECDRVIEEYRRDFPEDARRLWGPA